MKGNSEQGAQCAYTRPISDSDHWRKPTVVRQDPAHHQKGGGGGKTDLRKAVETSTELFKREGTENKFQ